MMQRNLRILGALALAGVVAFVGAQVRARSQGREFTSSGGQAIASPVQPLGQRTAPTSWGTEALQRLLITDANIYFRDAELAGQHDVMTKIVEVQCFAVLTTMTPAQQETEKNDVWQVKQYKPGGQWDHVTSAPSMVKALLTVDAATGKKIEAIWSDGSDRRMKPFTEMTNKVYADMQREGKWQVGTTEFNVEHHRRYSLLLDDYNRAKTRPVIARESLADLQSDMKRIRALLSPAQVQEWDAIEGNYRSLLSQVLEGKDPLHARLRK